MSNQGYIVIFIAFKDYSFGNFFNVCGHVVAKFN